MVLFKWMYVARRSKILGVVEYVYCTSSLLRTYTTSSTEGSLWANRRSTVSDIPRRSPLVRMHQLFLRSSLLSRKEQKRRANLHKSTIATLLPIMPNKMVIKILCWIFPLMLPPVQQCVRTWQTVLPPILGDSNSYLLAAPDMDVSINVAE